MICITTLTFSGLKDASKYQIHPDFRDKILGKKKPAMSLTVTLKDLVTGSD
jgi:hypothetical protein